MKIRARLIKRLEFLFVAVCFFLSGYLVHDIAARFDDDFGLLTQAQGYLAYNYLYELPDNLLLQRGMIEGMISSLNDPYTVYNTPDQHEINVDTFEGQFGGIGTRLVQDENEAYVLFPFPDGPAYSAGIRAGDILLSIDGVDLAADATMNAITALLRGEEGTNVAVRVHRPTQEGSRLDFAIQRASIQVPTVHAYLHPRDPSIGVVEIYLIGQQTPDEINRAFITLTDTGAERLILDLRGNGGGLLEESISIADYFLESGLIVSERYRDQDTREFYAAPGDAGETLALVVVVDNRSASGAELIAAALQQNHRAIIVGDTTFGKGTVQSIYELQDGSSIHITTAQWLTPSGAMLDGTGITPDVLVDTAIPGDDPAIITALHLLLEE